MKLWQKLFVIVLCLTLAACGTPKPPLKFAPNQDLIAKAIALQLELSGSRLAQQLDLETPNFEIRKIKLEGLKPLYLGKLPTFHVLGTYNLRLELPQQQSTQTENPFDLYLQLQSEGKTWRLILKRPREGAETEPHWSSYLIR